MLVTSIKIIKNELLKMLKNDSTHDLYHLERTMNNALEIQEKEGGDHLIIGVSAYIHDVHRLLSGERKKDGKDGYMSPKESLPYVKKILEKTQLSEQQINKVLHCVEYHEEYDFSENGKTAQDIETLILQDADNLDAIGVMGIARTFAYGGMVGIPIWTPEIPLRTKSAYDECHPVDHSTIHHFYSKLLRLKNNMNTLTGKSIAKERHARMINFLNNFYQEWGGETAKEASQLTKDFE